MSMERTIGDVTKTILGMLKREIEELKSKDKRGNMRKGEKEISGYKTELENRIEKHTENTNKKSEERNKEKRKGEKIKIKLDRIERERWNGRREREKERKNIIIMKLEVKNGKKERWWRKY